MLCERDDDFCLITHISQGKKTTLNIFKELPCRLLKAATFSPGCSAFHYRASVSRSPIHKKTERDGAPEKYGRKTDSYFPPHSPDPTFETAARQALWRWGAPCQVGAELRLPRAPRGRAAPEPSRDRKRARERAARGRRYPTARPQRGSPDTAGRPTPRGGGSAHRDAALRPASEAASAPLSSSCSFLRRLFLAHPLGSIQLCPLFLRGSPPFPTPLPSVVGSARRRLGD